MSEQEPPEQNGGGKGAQFANLLLRGWEPYLRFVRQCAQPPNGTTDLGKLQQRYMEFASTEGVAAYRKFSELNASYYSAVLNTGLKLSNEFYRQVFQTKNGATTTTDHPVTAARELVFTGPVGSSASRAFAVSNGTEKPAMVSFELSEFVKENGEEKLRVEALLNPRSFELAPQAERTIECSLPLAKEFEPGCEYRAVLRVIGFPNMQIGLLAKVEVAPSVDEAVPRATAPRSRRRKS